MKALPTLVIVASVLAAATVLNSSLVNAFGLSKRLDPAVCQAFQDPGEQAACAALAVGIAANRRWLSGLEFDLGTAGAF